MNTLPITQLYHTVSPTVTTLDLTRGDDDLRTICFTDDGERKLVIKRFSNTFSDEQRIGGWFALMDEYRRLGIYCPNIACGLDGRRLYKETVDGREFFIFAEEFAVYETAEHIGEDKYIDSNGRLIYTHDVMRSLGKVASAHLDVVDHPSAYCLLEPFCAPDTTDEATECAEAFTDCIRKELPKFTDRAESLLNIFYRRQSDLADIYHTLPTSCFQADLNASNILLDNNLEFVGLIDFNLCGREPILNYTVREALWASDDKRLYGKDESRLYFYDTKLDELRISLFLENMSHVAENYAFTAAERKAFTTLFRYINSFWWHQRHELKLIRDDDAKVSALLDWLEHQLNRDDVELP